MLGLAALLRQPQAPGLFTLLLLICLIFALFAFAWRVRRRLGLIRAATRLIKPYAGPAGLQPHFAEITEKIKAWKGADAQHFADTWEEFRETTIEPKPGVASGIKNAVRPTAFFNLDEMGFGVSGWRFVPGLFVSVGLAATFLGLIAALQQTGESLQSGGDQAKVMSALTQLLTVASAKFIMSLTGLVCSILFTIVLRYCSNRLDSAMLRFTHELELRMNFVSLEDIGERQLAAIMDQRDHMQKLNHELIAALSEPLHKAVSSNEAQMGSMIDQLSGSLTTGLVTAMTATSERLETASEKLSGLAGEIASAAEKFSTAAERTAVGLDGAARRLEIVSDNLSKAGNGLAEAAGPIVQAADKTASATQQIAASSIDMVNSARAALNSEKDVVIAASNSIRDQIKSFESRAAAYDGELEKAFSKYIEHIGQSIREVEAHSNNVHGQYAEALATLQAVIENAKSFEPESARPQS